MGEKITKVVKSIEDTRQEEQYRAWYNEYYSYQSVLFEIVKQLKGKEVALLGTQYSVRNIKAHNLAYLKSNLNSFDFFKRFYNIYISSAHYYNMPMFSFDPVKRRAESEKFKTDFKKYMITYDFFIDLDGTNNKLPFDNCDIILEFFNSYEVPYSLRLSGKGFHIVIPGEYFDFEKDLEKRAFIFKEFSRKLQIIFDLENLDLYMYDLRRVYKVPYSLDVKTMRICMPLNIVNYEDLRKNEDLFHVSNVLKQIKSNTFKIRNRGIKLRNDDFHASARVKKMFKFIIGDEIN